MNLTTEQKRLIERIVNVLESGRPLGDYGAIEVFANGPHGIRQLTYGRSRALEYSTLRPLVERYVAAGGSYARDLSDYADRIGAEPLTDHPQFRSLLRTAGRTDPVMRAVQDAVVEEEWFLPAMQWAKEHAFTLPLSALVIYDSFVHSGTILPLLLRRTSPHPLPSAGGDERAWTTAYVHARHTWLANHARSTVRHTTQRTSFLATQITRENWQLTLRPVRVCRVAL